MKKNAIKQKISNLTTIKTVKVYSKIYQVTENKMVGACRKNGR
jgi:hypothetical protein